MNLKTIDKYYRVDKREICFMKYTFDAYEGIAILTTIDPEAGYVKLIVPQGFEKEVDLIIDDMKKYIMVENVIDENSQKKRSL